MQTKSFFSRRITVELGYIVMKGNEHFVSLYMGVVLTEGAMLRLILKNRPEDDCSIVETCSLCNYLV